MIKKIRLFCSDMVWMLGHLLDHLTHKLYAYSERLDKPR